MKDKIVEEMSTFLFKLENLGIESRKIAEKTIDEATFNYQKDILNSVPVKTGELKESFKVEKSDRGNNYYGYNAEFKGVNRNGEPYAKIAAIQNTGTARFVGSHFIDKATKKLKGLTQKIEDNILDNMEVKTSGNNW